MIGIVKKDKSVIVRSEERQLTRKREVGQSQESLGTLNTDKSDSALR